MDLPTPIVRHLVPDDREALRSFSCSTGPSFEDEVQDHIRGRLLESHLSRRAHTGHRLIGLEMPGRGLVGVTAHEEDMLTAGGHDLTTTLWLVAAVAADLRGAILPDVDLGEERPVTLGRFLAEVALSDIDKTAREPFVRAVVARDNRRSLALCRRLGLTRELPYADSGYVSLLGDFRR